MIWLKFVFCLAMLAGVSVLESPRLEIPLRDFFSEESARALSMSVLGIASLISIFASKWPARISGAIIFLLVMSSYGSDLKRKYEHTVRTGRIKTQSLIQQEVPVPEKHKCYKDKEYPQLYPRCLADFSKKQDAVRSKNEGIRKANSEITDQTDWLEFHKNWFTAIGISCFFWLAISFFCWKASEQWIKIKAEIQNFSFRKSVKAESVKRNQTLNEKLSSLPVMEAVDLILKDRLFDCSNDRQALTALSKIRQLNFDAEYRKLKRQRKSKNDTVSHTVISVSHGYDTKIRRVK